MTHILKRIFFTIASITLYVACINSALSEPNKMRIVNVDTSKLQDDYDKAINTDHLEKYNRAVFSFNKSIDDYFLAPVARGYRYSVPEWLRGRVTAFYTNLQEPRNFLNSALQGDAEGLFRSFWRFVINSTFGIAGLHDVADGFGLEQKDKYFSQTLGIYGLNAGEYLVLPLFGPSTYRDFAGYVADTFADPSSYALIGGSESAEAAIRGGVNSVEVVEKREGVLDITDDLEEKSFDVYSTYKSSYLQNRKKRLEDTAE